MKTREETILFIILLRYIAIIPLKSCGRGILFNIFERLISILVFQYPSCWGITLVAFLY